MFGILPVLALQDEYVYHIAGLWIEIKGPRMKTIDTGMTNEVWAVGKDGKTYRLSVSKSWQEIKFNLKHVSVGEAGEYNLAR